MKCEKILNTKNSSETRTTKTGTNIVSVETNIKMK